MSRAKLEKRILRFHKGGTGILKIGKRSDRHRHGAARTDGAAAPFRRRRRWSGVCLSVKQKRPPVRFSAG